jgi:hypothetical protein
MWHAVASAPLAPLSVHRAACRHALVARLERLHLQAIQVQPDLLHAALQDAGKTKCCGFGMNRQQRSFQTARIECACEGTFRSDSPAKALYPQAINFGLA